MVNIKNSFASYKNLIKFSFQIAFRKKKKIKSFPLRVCSLDSTLEFNLDYNATGKLIVDILCVTSLIGICDFRRGAIRASLSRLR